MKRLAWRKPILLLLLVSVLLLGSAACTAEAKELAMAWFEDWVEENGTSMIAVGARWLLGTPTGSEDVDAAIDAGRAIRDIKEADELVEEGQKAQRAGDFDTAEEKIQQAVKKRPNDWTYKLALSMVLRESGDTNEWTWYNSDADSAASAQDLANGYKDGHGPTYEKYLRQNIQDLEDMKRRLDDKGYKSQEQKCQLYWSIHASASNLSTTYGSAEGKAKSMEYEKMYDAECK